MTANTTTQAVPAESDTLQKSFIHSFWFVILMGCLAAFDPLSIDMYLPAFPLIQADLKTTYSSVELSLSSFFIGMALGQIFYGPLADRYGRKLPLLGGMAVYLLASLACAFATNIESFIALRALQAFGGCAGMVITRAIVRDVFQSKRAAQFFSSMTLIFGLAPMLAPTIGSWIITFWEWHVIFLILAAGNLICLIAIAFLLPETHPVHKRKKDQTLIRSVKGYLHLLKDRWFIGYTLPDSFLRAGMFAYIAGSPFVFMELFQISPQAYSWIFGVNAMGLILLSQGNRVLLRWYNSDQILRATRYITLSAAAALFIIPFFSSSIWAVIIPLFIYVASLGLVGPNSTVMALAHQGHQAGLASALFGTLQWSVAMLSSFLVSRLHNGTVFQMTSVMLACGVISVLSFQFMVGRRDLLAVK